MLEQSSEEYRESVCKGLNTTLDQVKHNVQLLQDWLQTQPHLPHCATNTMLTTFLIACKNRVDTTKQKLDNYYTARGKMPETFDDRDPTNERFLEVNRELQLFFVPKMTPDGCRLVMMNFATGDAKKFDMGYYFKRMVNQEDVKMHREAFNKGRYVVFDGARFTMSHIFKISPKLMKHMIECTQDVLPVNIKGIIFINAPSVLYILLAFIKPFTKNKLLQRFHIHTEGPEILEKYFPTAILPKDYGGNEDTSEHLNEVWLQCLVANKEWLMNEGMLRTDEQKRIKVKNKELDTTFNNLTID